MSAFVQKIRAKVTFAGQVLIWRWLQLGARSITATEPSLVLVPCEPRSVIGSRGDEAMIYAVLGDFRKRHPAGRITVVCTHPVDAVSSPRSPYDDLRRLQADFPGLEFVPAWHGHNPLPKIAAAIRDAQATELYAIGADCMDGFYDPKVSLNLLAAADLAVRMGVKTRLTGFSFNASPKPQVVRLFRHASPELRFNLRDAISLERFEVLTKRRGTLVADTAFCLEPKFSERVNFWLDQMAADRKAGKKVLGFNLNPLLKAKTNIDEKVEWLKAKGDETSVYLVPHDYRGEGDLGELEKVVAKLPRAKIVRDVLSAAELKALMSGVDSLFTQRMHLGIAALGMGKPIEYDAYQGKFEGLMRHFRRCERCEKCEGLEKVMKLARKNLVGDDE